MTDPHESDADGVLYRRLRPKRFDGLVGQSATAAMLTNAVASPNTPHAWLFCGPRGTGKTSAARVLAAALSCTERPVGSGEPCGRCDACVGVARGRSLDVIEVDAASHSGVDAIRELCASAQLSPTGAHRVYILDEAHMLSNAASNALLKTLEEPPPHVTFVLATTDQRKVLPTVRSRCVTARFRLVGAAEMTEYLRSIAASERLDVDDAAIAAAVVAGAGSVRDTLSALEALAAGADPDAVEVAPVADAIEARDVAGTLAALDTVLGTGAEPRELVEDLASECRRRFLATMSGAAGDAPALVAAMEGLGAAMARTTAGWDARVALELGIVAALRSLPAKA